MRELHRVARAALAEAAQLIDVAEHVRERNDRLDDLGDSPAVGALDLPAAAVEIADHVAHEFLRGNNLDLHHRFEQLDAGLRRHFAHRRTASDFERQRRRIDVVIRAVGELDFEVDDREADHVTVFGRLAHALFDRRDIFARNVAALNLVDESDARAAFAGSDADLDAPELARAARLLLVGIVDIDGLRERFAVRHLRRADVRFDLELALHAIDEDVEVKLAHALADRLAR